MTHAAFVPQLGPSWARIARQAALARKNWPFQWPKTQPYNVPELNDQEPLTRWVALCCWNSAIEARTQTPINIGLSGRPPAARTNTVPPVPSYGRVIGSVLAPAFSAGVGHSTQTIVHNITPRICVSFWLYWNSFANDDQTGPLDANSNAGLGATCLRIAPNASGSGKFNFAITKDDGTGAWIAEITRPSGAQWHHYACNLDSAATGVSTCSDLTCVDGQPVAQTLASSGAGISAPFAPQKSHLFFSRGVDLFGNGRCVYVNIFRRWLTLGEMQRLYQHPTLLLRYPPMASYR